MILHQVGDVCRQGASFSPQSLESVADFYLNMYEAYTVSAHRVCHPKCSPDCPGLGRTYVKVKHLCLVSGAGQGCRCVMPDYMSPGLAISLTSMKQYCVNSQFSITWGILFSYGIIQNLHTVFFFPSLGLAPEGDDVICNFTFLQTFRWGRYKNLLGMGERERTVS